MKKVLLRSAIVVTIALSLAMTFMFSFSNGEAHAQSLKPANCQTWYRDFWFESSMVLEVDTANTGCQWDWQKAASFVANCGGSYNNAQTDVWQTRQFPGGTRYAETGRSGFATYPTDCKWYFVQQSNDWGGLQSPSYGCAWIQLFNSSGPAHDYNCVQAS